MEESREEESVVGAGAGEDAVGVGATSDSSHAHDSTIEGEEAPDEPIEGADDLPDDVRDGDLAAHEPEE